MTLALLLALGVALVAWFAPGALAGAFAYVIALMFDVFSGVAFAQRSTGGFISWSSALYALMLVALIPMLALLRRRARRQRSHPDE